mgnify:CR=1 FL=1
MAERQWNGRDWTGFELELRLLQRYAVVLRDEEQAINDNVAFPLENVIKAYKGEDGMRARDMRAGCAMGDLVKLQEQLCFDHGFDSMFVRDAYSRILDPNEIPRWRGRGVRHEIMPARNRNLLRAKHARREAVYREAVRRDAEVEE